MKFYKPKSSKLIALAALCVLAILLLLIPYSVKLPELSFPRFPKSEAIRSAIAAETKSHWIPGEDITIVLNEDFNTSFFFVEDRPEGGIDPIRSFLQVHEESIRGLFHHLLFRPGCVAKEIAEKWGTSCAHRSDGRQQIVIDVGCNRGYYTMLAASYGHKVYAFDPQPHCATLIGASIIMNDYGHTVNYTRAYVSDNTKGTMGVRRRTGCTGTFPNDNDGGWADGFRKPLEKLPGANDVVQIPGVSLDDIFNPRLHDVLLLKMDVEGFESHAMASAKRLLEGGAVRNVLVEFNIPMMGRQEEGKDAMKKSTLKLIRWLMGKLKYRCKGSHMGHWKTQAPMAIYEWQELLSFEEDKFLTIDAWFYK